MYNIAIANADYRKQKQLYTRYYMKFISYSYIDIYTPVAVETSSSSRLQPNIM